MEKFQVIFYGDGEDIPYTEQHFNSKTEAEKWAEDKEWDEQVEFWGDNGPEYKTQYYYHNPENKQNYTGYEVKLVNELNEEFIRMQKLAGLITEEEYKIKLKEETDTKLRAFLNDFKSKNQEFQNLLKDKGYV